VEIAELRMLRELGQTPRGGRLCGRRAQGEEAEPYDVLLLKKDGTTELFAHH